jgi:hypothetical protein
VGFIAVPPSHGACHPISYQATKYPDMEKALLSHLNQRFNPLHSCCPQQPAKCCSQLGSIMADNAHEVNKKGGELSINHDKYSLSVMKITYNYVVNVES